MRTRTARVDVEKSLAFDRYKTMQRQMRIVHETVWSVGSAIDGNNDRREQRSTATAINSNSERAEMHGERGVAWLRAGTVIIGNNYNNTRARNVRVLEGLIDGRCVLSINARGYLNDSAPLAERAFSAIDTVIEPRELRERLQPTARNYWLLKTISQTAFANATSTIISEYFISATRAN